LDNLPDADDWLEDGDVIRLPTPAEIAKIFKDQDDHITKKRKKVNEELLVSPRRMQMHDKAYSVQVKRARRMQARAGKIDGDRNVGDIVRIPLHPSDQTKVDSKCLTVVIVEITKNGQLRCACPTGVLDRPYAKHQVLSVKKESNNRKLLGLEDAFLTWEGLPRISERAAARASSLVGGQGHNVRCDCKTACNTNRCKCIKAGLLCSSKCHRGNTCCVNHEK